MGSRLLQDMKREARTGLWKPFSDHARQFTESVVEHFFRLPLGIETTYLRIIVRCIEASPERCVQSFNHLEVMKLSEYERRECADLACGSIGLYDFAPRELQGFRTQLVALATDESLPDIERVAHEACRIRFMHYCTWVEVYRQKELSLRTSAGTFMAPTQQPSVPERPKGRPTLRLVPSS
ncbi:hypothetical protein IT407_01680 [Candidatus Uhrbacteria bacterium]|nr:hypothetical protein [Candidatus Uhrbacteria bacterium]